MKHDSRKIIINLIQMLFLIPLLPQLVLPPFYNSFRRCSSRSATTASVSISFSIFFAQTHSHLQIQMLGFIRRTVNFGFTNECRISNFYVFTNESTIHERIQVGKFNCWDSLTWTVNFRFTNESRISKFYRLTNESTDTRTNPN